MTTKTNPNEMTRTRFYEAPASVIWDAWNDPAQASEWWGPRGFTLTSHSKDLRTGGHWHYTMHGPNGADYVNKTKYLEVLPHKKMVYDHGGNDEQKPLFRVTVLFNEVKGGTVMEMTMAFENEEAKKQSKQFIKKAGGEATWDRLGEYLTKRSTNKDIFIINRAFDASIETLWDMWTNPEHFSKWLAPTGFNMKFIKKDIRAGGTSYYSMSSEKSDMTMHGRIDYISLDKPTTLIYTQQFTDEKGNVSRHSMAPTWPETMRTTIRFTEETSQCTRVTVTWEVVGKATNEEMQTFINGRSGMTQGWTGSFDKLETYLTTASSR